MAKPITGKTHVGERREKRPNGDIYVYERITCYNEKTRKTHTINQKLKGKIRAGTQEITSTRPKKRKSERRCVTATQRHTGLMDILEWVGSMVNRIGGQGLSVPRTPGFARKIVYALADFQDRYRNRRKRFGLRFNLIAGIHNLELRLRI